MKILNGFPERKNSKYLFSLSLVLFNMFLYSSVWKQWFFADDFHWLYFGRISTQHPLLLLNHTIFHYFRPTINVIFWLENLLYGISAPGHHLFNLFSHLISTLLLFHLLLKLNVSFYSAFISSIICSISPGTVDAIVWISGRIDILASLFYLLALNCFLRSNRSGLSNLCGIFAFIVAGLTKENTLTLPFCLFLLEYFFNNKSISQWIKERWLVLTVGIILLAFHVLYQIINGPYLTKIGNETNIKIFFSNLTGIIPFFIFDSFPIKFPWKYSVTSTYLILFFIYFFVPKELRKTFLGSIFVTILLSIPAAIIPFSFFPDPHLTFRRFFYLSQLGFALISMIIFSAFSKLRTKKQVIIFFLIFLFVLLSVQKNLTLQDKWYQISTSRKIALKEINKMTSHIPLSEVVTIIAPDTNTWPEMFYLFLNHNVIVKRHDAENNTSSHNTFLFYQGKFRKL